MVDIFETGLEMGGSRCVLIRSDVINSTPRMNLRGLQDPDPSDNPKGHAFVMLTKVILLGLDVLCLAVAVGLHKVVDLLADWVIPPDWNILRKFLTAVFAVSFSLIYIHLAFDMVLIFVPWLRGRQKLTDAPTAPAPKTEEPQRHTIKKGHGK